ncbi:MAG: RDD family protein [Tetrasphaera sp.]|nr:RDD family protein [Tetrasphaera sp.]
MLNLLLYLGFSGGAALYHPRAVGTLGQTVGKAVMGMRVVDATTRRPIGVGRALGRGFYQFLMMIPVGWVSSRCSTTRPGGIVGGTTRCQGRSSSAPWCLSGRRSRRHGRSPRASTRVAMSEFEAVAVTSVGRVRSLNEDAWYAGEHLVVVADGMGGHAAGDVASALTIDTLPAGRGRRGACGVGCRRGGGQPGGPRARTTTSGVSGPRVDGLRSGSHSGGLARVQRRGLPAATSSTVELCDRSRSTIPEVQELIDGHLITHEEARCIPIAM